MCCCRYPAVLNATAARTSLHGTSTGYLVRAHPLLVVFCLPALWRAGCWSFALSPSRAFALVLALGPQHSAVLGQVCLAFASLSWILSCWSLRFVDLADYVMCLVTDLVRPSHRSALLISTWRTSLSLISSRLSLSLLLSFALSLSLSFLSSIEHRLYFGLAC